MSRGEMLQVWQRSRFRVDDFAEDNFETMSKCPFIRSMRTSGERMDSLQRWDKTMEFTIADKYKSKQQCCCCWSNTIHSVDGDEDDLWWFRFIQQSAKPWERKTSTNWWEIKTICIFENKNKVFQESLNGDMKEMIKFTYELKCFKDALDIRVNTQFVVIS